MLPPLVDTDMTTDIAAPKISTEKLVNGLISGIKADQYIIRVGDAKRIYTANRFFPKSAFSLLNNKKFYSILE